MNNFWRRQVEALVHRLHRNLHRFVNFLFVFFCEVGTPDNHHLRHSSIMMMVRILTPSLLNINIAIELYNNLSMVY
jgi:hypothetical protein